MDKEEIISYVMKTPENTNPNVLRSLLDSKANSNKFIVTLTLTSETGGITDKSNKEIYEAIQAGKEIWFTGNMSDMVGYFPLAYYTVIEGYQYPFIGTRFDMVSSSDQVYLVYMIASDTEIYNFSMESHSYEKEDNKFIVTLTPTALDYSGTMDKTVAEINAAYEAGMEIWFKVLTSASTSVEIPLTYWATDSSYDYHGFSANIVQVGANMLIVAYVGSTSDGTRQTYDTQIYSLTPAS